MENEIKFPVTYRASYIWLVGAFLIFLYFVLGNLLKFVSVLLQTHSWVALLYLIYPFVFGPIVFRIFTYKTVIDERGFQIFGLFRASAAKRLVRWSEITKIAARTGTYAGLEIYFQGMKPYSPAKLGLFFSKKALGQVFEIVSMKAPGAELGMGVQEFKNKYLRLDIDAS